MHTTDYHRDGDDDDDDDDYDDDDDEEEEEQDQYQDIWEGTPRCSEDYGGRTSSPFVIVSATKNSSSQFDEISCANDVLIVFLQEDETDVMSQRYSNLDLDLYLPFKGVDIPMKAHVGWVNGYRSIFFWTIFRHGSNMCHLKIHLPSGYD